MLLSNISMHLAAFFNFYSKFEFKVVIIYLYLNQSEDTFLVLFLKESTLKSNNKGEVPADAYLEEQ